jgi:2-dehydro-3-deoxygluconokinase
VAESNVAIALTKLGHQVGWFSKLGNDEFGKYIQATIRGEGVDVSRVIFDPVKYTGILFKERFMHSNPSVYYYRKDSAASNLKSEELDESYIRDAKILHITGITPALSENCRKTLFKAIEIAKANNVLVSFDPNIRLKLWTKEEAIPVLLEIAKQSDIIFPGIDEGEMLLGLTNPEEIAESLMNMGCSIVAVKIA